MSKKTFSILIVLIAALALVGYLIWSKSGHNGSNNAKANTSQEFAGTIRSIKDDNITIDGVFMTSDGKNLGTEGKTQTENVIVDGNTKITRTAIKIPTTTGRFDPSTLPQTTTIVNLQKLIEDVAAGSVGIYAKSKTNVYDKSTFTASEINYRVGDTSK